MVKLKKEWQIMTESEAKKYMLIEKECINRDCDNESCYCHHDDTDEYHDCLDYMECEECPYYYADLD